jgi:hypothetical protein
MIALKDFNNMAKSIKTNGTVYFNRNNGIMCAIYLGNLLLTKKSSKVVFVFIEKTAKNLITILLKILSKKYAIITIVLNVTSKFIVDAQKSDIPLLSNISLIKLVYFIITKFSNIIF